MVGALVTTEASSVSLESRIRMTLFRSRRATLSVERAARSDSKYWAEEIGKERRGKGKEEEMEEVEEVDEVEEVEEEVGAEMVL